MNASKNFAKIAKTVADENAKIMPDVFTEVGKPEVTDISRDELGEEDAYKRFTISHKDTSVKARFARGTSENADSYNLQLMESNREIKIAGQDPIAKGYKVWRLVAA